MCKREILQSYSRDEADHTRELYVSFVVTSDDINPDEITERTGVTPNRAWRKGEKWSTERVSEETGKFVKHELKRVNGVWVISSEKKNSIFIC